MEDRQVCRLAKKVRLSSELYAFKTLGYVDNAYFNEEGELYFGKKRKLIPYCCDEEFLHSDKTVCYTDAIFASELERVYGVNDFEQNFENYVKDCEKFATLVFYDKESKFYDIAKFDNDKFSEFYQFSEMSYSFDIYKNSTVEPLVFLYDKVVLRKSFYEKIADCVKAGDLTKIQPTFAQTELYLQALQGNSQALPVIVSTKNEDYDNLTLEEMIAKLNELVGLGNIKLEVSKLINYLKFLDSSKEYVSLNKPNLNMVFTGSAGTGKTTVAKIVSAILNKLEFANDKILECTAKDFIAEYVGQTAIKTNKLIQQAKGGVIFIDEAYIFASRSNEFAGEALTEILKEMEKNETVFIFSGYKKEMEEFIRLNSGLTSRVGHYFDFKDYTPSQLFEIFELKLKNSKMVISSGCKIKLMSIFEKAKNSKDFGNGRFVDKLFDNIIFQHAFNNMDVTDKDKLITIVEQDINDDVLEQIIYKPGQEKRIGFTN